MYPIRFKRHAVYLQYLVFLFSYLYAVPLNAQKLIHEPGWFQDRSEFNTLKTDTGHIMGLIRKGTALSDTYPDSSLQYYREAWNKSRISGFGTGSIKALNNIGIYYFGKNAFDKSIAIFREALQYPDISGSGDLRASLYYNLGLCYGRKGSYDQAIAFYKQALSRSNSIHQEQSLLFRIYSELGVSYQYKGQYELAASCYYAIIRNMGQPARTNYTYALDAYNRLGVIQLQLKLHERAFSCLNQGEQLAKAFRDTAMLAKIWLNQGAVYSDLNQKEKAQEIYLRIYTLARQSGYYGVQLTAASNLAKLLTDKNEPLKALPYAKEALALSKETRDIDGDINARFALGYIFFQMKRYKQAQVYLETALQEMYHKGLTGNTTNAHEVLAYVYAATGQYKKAFDQEHTYVKMNDSLRGTLNAQAVNDLEAKYQSARKDKDLAQQRLQITQQQNQLRENKLWFGGIALIVLLLTTTLLGMYRSNRHKQKLQASVIHNLRQQQELNQLRAQVKGEEQERKRIARELHDGIASQLYALRMNVSSLSNRKSAPINPGELDEVLRQLEEAGKEVRTTAHNLVPDLVLQEGLAIAVAAFCEKTERSAHLEIDFLTCGVLPRLDPVIELSIYRMVQELVQNILKHAAATQILVQLSCEEELLQVTVEDNGIGLDNRERNRTGGSGLAGIEARMAALNGHMDVKSIKDKGTAICLEFDIHGLTTIQALY